MFSRWRQLTVSAAADLVIGLVAVLDAQVVSVKVHLEVREQQLLLDQVPDDAGHFVAENVDDGSSLDLVGHFGLAFEAGRRKFLKKKPNATTTTTKPPKLSDCKAAETPTCLEESAKRSAMRRQVFFEGVRVSCSVARLKSSRR